jgi:hypothetical protein
VDFVGVDLRGECRGPVVGQRQAVDHELGLVLRSAGMQNAVGFEEPAWLRIHQLGERSTGQRRRAPLQRVGADPVRRRRLMQIHQRVAGGDRDLRLDRSQGHRDPVVRGQRGTNFHQPRKPSETVARNGHAIRTEGQAPDDGEAVGIGGQGFTHLLRLAHELDGAHQRQAAPSVTTRRNSPVLAGPNWARAIARAIRQPDTAQELYYF